MAQETIFSKIIRKEIPANIVYQDELVTAFRDISPQAKTHILIIPNKVIPTVNDVTEQDEVTLGRLFTVAAKIAKEEVMKIAELKMPDLNGASVETAYSMICGTARSMGIVVEE